VEVEDEASDPISAYNPKIKTIKATRATRITNSIVYSLEVVCIVNKMNDVKYNESTNICTKLIDSIAYSLCCYEIA
jgi:hypothetical protein